MTGRCSVGLLLFAIVLLRTTSAGGAEGVDTVRAEVAHAHRIVDAWAAKNHVFAEPTIVYDVTGQIMHFEEVFCGTPRSDRCRASLEPEMLEGTVSSYLDDVFSPKRARVRTLLSRLAQTVGATLEMAGWTDAPVFDRYVLVDLPAIAAGQRLFYVHWNGVQLVPSDAMRGALSVGRHSFAVAAASDATETYDVEVSIGPDGSRVPTTTRSSGPVSGSVAAVAAGKILPDYQRYSLEQHPDRNDPRQQSHTGRAGTDVSKPSPFRDAAVMRLEFTGASDICDEGCRTKVADAFLEALITWRVGCARCAPGVLKMVEVGSRRYVETSLVEWLNFRPAPPPQSGGNPKETAAWANLLLAQIGPLSSARGFDRVEAGDSVSRALCNWGQSSADVQRHALSLDLSQLGKRLCHPVDTCETAVGCILIRVNLDQSDCGDFVACGKPDGSVGFNTRSYSFRLSWGASGAGIPEILFGKGSVRMPIAAVALHEVGHWFGVDHVEQPKPFADGRFNVMADGMSERDRSCITRGNLVMMDNAIDEAWDFRLVTGEALRYDPSLP